MVCLVRVLWMVVVVVFQWFVVFVRVCHWLRCLCVLVLMWCLTLVGVNLLMCFFVYVCLCLAVFCACVWCLSDIV